jgi:hypothetical protein
MPGGLTLRPGRQKDFYMEHLSAHYPGLVDRYREIYREERASGACTRQYRDGLAARIASAMQGTGVPFLLPHALYRGAVPLYDELYLLLQHMAELYSARGVPVAGLKAASGRYADWLLAKKRIFNRKRSIRQEDLEEETRTLFASGEAATLLGNEKLTRFLGEVALERRVLDYLSLALSPPSSPAA